MSELLKGIEVVLLDVDGTILDFEACVVDVMRKGFEKFGLPGYEPWMLDVFNRINEGLWEQLERGEITRAQLFEVRWNRIFEALGFNFDGAVMESLFRENLMTSGIPVSGAEQMLRALAKQFSLGIASNGPYEQQRNRLMTAGLDDLFKYFFVSQRIGCAKPDSRFFTAAMEEINEDRMTRGLGEIGPGQILMVGDSLTADMDGGIQYGMKTCYYDPRNKGTQGRQVDLVIHDLNELQILAAESEHAKKT